MKIRIMLDIGMTALILAAMAYRIIGGLAHEIIGISVIGLFIAHNLLNGRWYKTLGKGKYRARRYGVATVNLLLVFTALVLMVSGILHSKELFGLAGEEDNGSIFGAWQIHALAAYWMFMLVSVHLGIYWSTLIKVVPAKNKTISILMRLTGTGLALGGIKAFMDRNIANKLILYYSFDFWHTSEPFYSYMGSYLTIMSLMVFITHYLRKIKNPFPLHKGKIH